MTKLKIHYQLIEAETGGIPTVHEAYTRDDVLIMINPEPVIVMGETVEDDIELTLIVEKDIEKYGIITDAEQLFINYIEHFNVNLSVPYEDYNVDDEDSVIWYDDLDNEDTVIAIDEFMKRRNQ